MAELKQDEGGTSSSRPSLTEEELLERVFLKIVLAETDEQLEKVLNNFLCSILLKLASGKETVKSKVLEMLTHINKRLRSRPKIDLPVEDLIKQYQDRSSGNIVQNFSILYIKMGYPRLDESKQSLLIPQLFLCLSGKNATQQDVILRLILPAMSDLHYSDSIEERKNLCPILGDKSLIKVCLDFFMDFLLLPYGSESVDQPSNSSTASPPPPGLSLAATKRLTFDPVLKNDQIEKAKLGILKFLSSNLFEANDVLCHFVAANGDPKHSVCDAAEHAIKKFASSEDWEKDEIIDTLYRLFQGTVVARGNSRQALSPEHARSPANARQKIKIFPFLLKSRRATDFNPASCIQIIFESLFGESTNSKLKKYALDLCHNMTRHSSDKTMAFASPFIFQANMKLISDNKLEVNLRCLSYTGLSLLAKRAPHLFKRDVAIVQKLFQTLEEEDKDVRVSVQETLSAIAPCYSGITGSAAQMMEALILSNVEKEMQASALASLQLANAVFPRTHVPTRYACLLSSGSQRDDVKEEARKGLTSQKWRDIFVIEEKPSEKALYPDFREMIAYILGKLNEKQKSKSSGALLYSNAVLQQMLRYMRDCLRASAGISDKDVLNDNTLQLIANYVKILLAKVETSEAVYQYVHFIKMTLQPGSDNSVQTEALENLLEILCASPDKLGSYLVTDVDWIKTFMNSGKEEIRYFSARIISMLFWNFSRDEQIKYLQKLTGEIDGQAPLEVKHGIILTLAFCITQFKESKMELEDMEVNGNGNCEMSVVQDTVVKIAQLLYTEDTLLQNGACMAIGELGKVMALPLDDGNDEREHSSLPGLAKKIKTENVSKLLVVKGLHDILQKGKDTKTKEKAARSLGYICLGDRNFAHVKTVTKILLETAKLRQIELNFSVGEALACVGAGRLSNAGHDKWSLHQVTVTKEETTQTSHMKDIVTSIIRDYTYSSAAYNRQASAIWLMSIVKFASSHAAVKELLAVFQTAFTDLLSDSDELTQDIASRGITSVYELVEEDKRDVLVQQLVDCLMTGKRPKHSFDSETQIFKTGDLGKTPDGGSLTTYKELCSLASSMNKPELIYKFMNLANHNAMWNSKKGAAFGFLGIASLAKKQLEPYLATLIPKLYRYQYDPNPGVQRSMSSIWSALVPEGKKALDKYTDAILKDLKMNLVSPLWRNRESSCFALADLLKLILPEELLPYLSEVWEMLFKVMDDIKESVRTAALVAMKNLNKITIRMCDVTLSKHGEETIQVILPVLLDTGLESRVAEVRAVSLQSLVQLSKNAGKLMKPHIPKFAVSLLIALSALEPQALNTLNLRISGSDEAQEKLDNLRISASKSSPMMEALKSCVQYIDEGVLTMMVPQLCDLMKSGIGLRTKVGCADFVTSIVLQCRDEITPFSGRLLKGLLNGVKDSNSAVKTAYANCVGRMLQHTKEGSITRLIEKLNEWYLKREEDKTGQRSSASVYVAMLRYSPDKLKEFAPSVLPIVFLAMEEDKTSGSSTATDEGTNLWEEIWNGMTPGTVVGIKQYQSEIVTTICTHLTSPSWSIRAQSARAAGKVAEYLGTALIQPYLGQLLSALTSAIPGRIWVGKENLVKALAMICRKCSVAIEGEEKKNDDFPRRNHMVDVLLKECQKGKLDYKLIALAETSDVIQSFKVDKFADMKTIVDKLLEKEGDDDDGSDDEKAKSRTKMIDAMTVVFESIGKSWPWEEKTQAVYRSYVFDKCIGSIHEVSWKTQYAILKTLSVFIDRLVWQSACEEWKAMDGSQYSEYIVNRLTPELCACIDNATVGTVVVEAMSCLAILTTKLKEYSLIHLMNAYVSRVQELVKTLAKKSNYKIDELSRSILSSLNTDR